MKKIKILLMIFSFLFIFSLSFDKTYAACSTSPCRALNEKTLKTLEKCIDNGQAATDDANEGAYACGQNKIVGFLSGDALDHGPPDVPLDVEVPKTSSAYGITTMTDHFNLFGSNLSDKIEERMTNVTKAYGRMNNNLLNVLVSGQVSHIEANTSLEQNRLKQEMEYRSDLKATAIRENQSPVGTGTSEEILFILDKLDNADTVHASVVIAEMKAKYDANDDFKLPVRLKHTEGLTESAIDCPEYLADPNNEITDFSCYKAQSANPGKTLETYYIECSKIKSREIGKLREKASLEAQKEKAQKESEISVKSTSSTSAVIGQEIINKNVACTGGDIVNGNCVVKDSYASPDEYRSNLINDIIENKIVVGGSTSSLNLLEPAIVGGIDKNAGLSEEDYQKLLAKAGEVKDVAVSSNTPKLIATYKTSSQYLAANSYANTIVGQSIVANIQPENRNDLRTSTFVSSYRQRQAMLNLSKLTYAESIAARTGEKLANKIHDEDFDYKDDVILEDINGAGKIDSLRHDVETNFENVVSGNIDSGALEGQMSLKAKMYQSEVQKARLSFESYLHWNRVELLLASMLVEKVNTSSNKELIRDLKRE